jgi:soluble lytic murein transglycosylase-like protein
VFPSYNEKVAKAIVADLARRYGGNVDEILAAYNAGPRRANRFRAAGDNPGVLPSETQGYLDRAHKMSGYVTRVEINNNTGANAVSVVHQVAQ